MSAALRAIAEETRDRRLLIKQNTLKSLLQLVDNACLIAQEKGIEPRLVFEDDNLYRELMNRTISPADYIKSYMDSAYMSYEDMLEFNITANLVSSGRLTIDYHLRRLLKSQIDTVNRRQLYDRQRNALKQVLFERLQYYWGDVVLESRPPEAQGLLSKLQ